MTDYNIITGIINIINDQQKKLCSSNNTHNRLYALGEPLEDYIKDVFSGAIGLSTQNKIQSHARAFSYGGAKNNPPDAVLKYGDAIEVKKVESIGDIPLNSSYPKNRLYRDDPKLTSFCRNIDDGNWNVKDIIYAIGCVDKKSHILKSLVMVYGSIYCADKEYYEPIFNSIKESIKCAPLTLEETEELAHINNVDPLGITYFRARGMWGISHPFKVFDYLHKYGRQNNFELMVIIPSDKFESFNNINELLELSHRDENLVIKDEQVKNPNNTVEMINVKLITYKQ